MRSRFTGYVSPSEWRWVIVISTVLILTVFIPYLWVILNTTSGGLATSGSVVTTNGDASMQFMGALHDFQNTAAAISKIVEASGDGLLTHYLYTPEAHNPTFLESAIYIVLGFISRVAGFSPIVLFHIARVGASLFMYMSIYYFASVIWSRIRTRRLFFSIAVFSSGLGWFFAPLLQEPSFIDIRGSVLYPFQVTMTNVHMPLAIGALSILTAAIIAALRPGQLENPSVTNSGFIVFILSVIIALLYPQALVPVAVSFFTLILTHSLTRRGIVMRDIRWMMWFGIPALPLFAYYFIVLIYNPVLAGIWIQDNTSEIINPIYFLISLGIPLIIAIPGIYRAARRFEPDGNQFMFGWMIAMVLLIFLTPFVRLQFGLGFMLPIAYFAARALEDFWFQYVSRVQRIRLFVALIPVIFLSNIYVLTTPLFAITQERIEETGHFLPLDYAFAFQWLAGQTDSDSVILASPQVSIWIPAWTGARVIYGHPTQTIDAHTKREAVVEWFAAKASADDGLPDICRDVLNGRYTVTEPYRVRYVLAGPLELTEGRSVCLNDLIPTVSFGSVNIYRVPIR